MTGVMIAAFVLAFVCAVAVYALALLKSHCFSKRELQELPMGGKILRLAIRLHL